MASAGAATLSSSGAMAGSQGKVLNRLGQVRVSSHGWLRLHVSSLRHGAKREACRSLSGCENVHHSGWILGGSWVD